MKAQLAVRIASAAVLTSLMASGGVSTGDVYASKTPGIYWSSVRQKTNSIALDWPQDAVRAELVILPVSGRTADQQVVSIPAGTASYAWTAFDGVAPERDEVYSLALTYLDSSDAPVGEVQTADVTVLRTSFAAADLPVDKTAAGWKKVRGSAVIPYDAGWFTNQQAGTVSTLQRTKVGTAILDEDDLSGAGWFGWNFKRSGYGSSGTFGLVLGNGDAAENLEAGLEALPFGLMMMIR